MEKGMHGGIPKLRSLSLLGYFLGVHGGIPKLERLTLPNLLSSSSFAYLKTSFIRNSSNLIRVVSTHDNYFFSTGNKDILEDLLFLNTAKKKFANKKQA